MKKTLIALAVAGISFNALAVDLDAAKADQEAIKYAKEQTLDSTMVVASGAAVLAEVKAGFALTTPYVRFDLSNGATFNSATLAGLTGTSGNTDGNGTWSLASGGVGESFAIFNIAGGTASDIELTLDGDIKVANKADVAISYNIYETASNAVNQQNGLVTAKSGTLLTFVDTLKVSATADADLLKIDLTDPSNGTRFEGDALTTDLVNLSVALADTGILLQDGTPIANTDDVFTTGTWTISGNLKTPFDATIPLSNFTVAADDLSASANVSGAAAPAALTLDSALNIQAGNTVSIPTETYSAQFVVGTPVNDLNFGTFTFNNLVSLKKNGSSAEVELALKPGGAYANFIRITNKTSRAGAMTINVFDDAGTAYQTTLGDVLGADKAELAAQASTDQIAIDAIAAAAGVPAGYNGKLRLVIDAQVPVQAGLNSITSSAADSNGTDTLTTTSTDVVSGIAVQSYAVNTNNGVLTLLK